MSRQLGLVLWPVYLQNAVYFLREWADTLLVQYVAEKVYRVHHELAISFSKRSPFLLKTLQGCFEVGKVLLICSSTHDCVVLVWVTYRLFC